MNKTEFFKTHIENRDKEILEYQINIDNFTRAIAKIETEYTDSVEMSAFKTQLEKLLKENQTEQLKSIIIRDVMVDQLQELETA